MISGGMVAGTMPERAAGFQHLSDKLQRKPTEFPANTAGFPCSRAADMRIACG